MPFELPAGWRPTRLGDLISVEHGFAFKSEGFCDPEPGTPIVVSVGNFDYSGGFRFATTTTKGYADPFPERFRLTAGDILLVMTCQTQGGEILGIPGRIPDDGRTYLHNQRLGRVLFRDRSRLDPSFAYWLFHDPRFNAALRQSASGSKILHTAPARIEGYLVAVPPISEQRSIAAVLDALYDKTQGNRRLADQAAEISRAEFRRVFGGRIEGPTPLGEHVSVTRGRSYKSSELEQSDHALVTLKSIRPGGGYSADGLKPYTGDFKPEQVLEPGDLVVAQTDLTQNAAVVGKPALIPDRGDFTRLIASLDLAIVRPLSDRVSVPFLFHLMLEPAFQQHAYGYSNGSTVLHLAKEAIPSFTLELPDPQVVTGFDTLAEPLVSLSNKLSVESRTLARVRDALLPKLISGAIRVPDTADPGEVIEPAAAELAAGSA